MCIRDSLKQQIEKAREIDERMQKLRERRAGGRTSADDGTDAGRTGSERPETVSYTHLDVYKRQLYCRPIVIVSFRRPSFQTFYGCLLYTSRCV